jgi:hypothetical protein
LAAAETPLDFSEITAPEHDYWNRPLDDALTRYLADAAKEDESIAPTDDKAFLATFLAALDIPASSQILLFSKTSLQLGLIFPRNPRAIYFNDEISVGYIPGGKIEVASVDPHLGAVFHIFDIPRGRRPLAVERSRRCMNCHADAETHEVPGFVIKSVIPGPNGGSLDGFRGGETGHHVPLAERFGGYYLTGAPRGTAPHANLVGEFIDGEIVTEHLPFGAVFDLDRYLAPGSDLLPHLIHEHQAGFTNRVIAASYLCRTLLAEGDGTVRPERLALLDERAAELTRYILFADEAALPKGGIEGDPAFREAFLAKALPDARGRSLRQFDLRDRLVKHRCSYMIYSRAFQALPPIMKERVQARIRAALRPDSGPEFSYLPRAEKEAIAAILRETFPR